MFKKILRTTMLALLIGVSTPGLALGTPLTEVQSLIESGYVDPVASSVLEATTIEETIERLGDPYTDHFTPEEYQAFVDSMDMTFSGIGVYVEMVSQGVLVTQVIASSPASEAGLQEGDIIIEAGGKSLAGLTQESATAILKGPDGTSIDIVIIRGEEKLNVNVLRRAIEMPTVTGGIFKGHIGYIAIESFGDATAEKFAEMVKGLKGKGADSWIIDVRNNPGGYLDTALELAGFFIGEKTAVQIKERRGDRESQSAKLQEVMIQEPTVFLTNQYSASASELLAAAVKDYEKAVVIGNRTYGKGSVQSMYELSDGGVLKMTDAKFYSPLGKEINVLGVNPDFPVVENDSLLAAILVLEGASEEEVKLVAAGKEWEIDIEEARKTEYWETYGELIENSLARTEFTVEELTEQWPLYYPGYKVVNALEDIPLDKKFTVKFNGQVDWPSVTEGTFELIESESGQRVPIDFQPVNEIEVIVSPIELLQKDKTYWLVTHKGIKGVNNQPMRKGVIAVAHT